VAAAAVLVAGCATSDVSPGLLVANQTDRHVEVWVRLACSGEVVVDRAFPLGAGERHQEATRARGDCTIEAAEGNQSDEASFADVQRFAWLNVIVFPPEAEIDDELHLGFTPRKFGE
jgi:hypothetical protein